jgi:eukaryotic-like serine/threonine-protein kinase
VRPASGAESERQIQVKFNVSFPSDWSPDGRFIAFHGSATLGAYDITILDWPSGTKPTPFAESPFTEMDSHFSPDGRWLAYASDVSGRMEVYVQAFPKSGNVIRVSSSGGSEPHWRRDSRELFYMGADRMVMAVPVVLGTSFQASSPLALFPSRAPFISSPSTTSKNLVFRLAQSTSRRSLRRRVREIQFAARQRKFSTRMMSPCGWATQ